MSRPLAAVGGAAGLLVPLAVAPVGPEYVALALAGLLALALGTYRDRGRDVTVGALVLFAAVLLAAIDGLAAVLVVLATLGAILAWDATEHARSLRRQLGPHAGVDRAALVHVAGTVLAGGTVAALALGTLVVARGRLPAVAGVFLVLGAILLAAALIPVGRQLRG